MQSVAGIATIVAACVSAFIAVISTFLSARLAESRSYREKVWERKAVAYSEVLEAVCQMQALLDRWFERAITYSEAVQEHEERERAEFRDAKRRMLAVFWREQWSLPDEVVTRMERLKAELEAPSDSWVEDLDASAFACKTAAADVRQMARSDMLGQKKQIGWRTALAGKKI